MSLIKNVTQLRKNIGGVQRSMDYEMWEASLDDAVEFHLEPVLGMEFIEELAAKVDGEPADEAVTVNGTDEEKRLIKLLQRAQVAYADMEGMMSQIVSTGDSGKQMPSPSNAQAVSKWATVALIKTAIRKGDMALEKALSYIDEHINAFGTYKNGTVYAKRAGLIVNSAAKLTEGFGFCNGSRRMYLALVPELKRAQEWVGSSVIGVGFLADVVTKSKEQIAGTNSDAMWKELIARVTKVICLRAVAERIPFLNIDADWHLWSETDGIDNKDVLSAERRNELKREVEQALDNERYGLNVFLQSNSSSTVFPGFYESVLYVGVEATGGEVKRFFENDSSKSYFAL